MDTQQEYGKNVRDPQLIEQVLLNSADSGGFSSCVVKVSVWVRSVVLALAHGLQ